MFYYDISGDVSGVTVQSKLTLVYCTLNKRKVIKIYQTEMSSLNFTMKVSHRPTIFTSLSNVYGLDL